MQKKNLCVGGCSLSLTYLETVKKVIKLFRWEVPRQLGQEVMDIFHNGLMLTSLQVYRDVNPAIRLIKYLKYPKIVPS